MIGCAIALVVTALLSTGCGSRSVRGGGGGGAGGGALEHAYPVLGRVPAGVSYAAAARRAGDGVIALGELAGLASMAELAASGSDQATRAAFGEALSGIDLAAAGLDPDASAAVFGQRGSPTAIVRVADDGRLRGFLDQHRDGDAGAGAASHRGHQIASWSLGGWEVASVALDGWLIVHLVGQGGAGDLGWLDDVLAAADGASLGGDALMAAAAERGAEALRAGGADGGAAATPDLIGMVRTGPLGRELAAQDGTPPGMADCAGRAAAAAPQLVWAAEVSPGGVDAWAGLDLAPAAARDLRASIAPPPPPGYAAYRAGAAISVDWSIDLRLLERARAALDCPGLDRPIGDPVLAATGFAGPRAWHVAATELDPDGLSGAGAVHLVLTDPALIEAQLESIPARSLFERTRRVAGQEVKVLSVPGLPTLVYRLDADRFTLAIGDGVIGVVLGPGDRPAVAQELARLALRPPRLANLSDLLATGFDAVAGRAASAAGRALADRLARYDALSIAAAMDGDSVAVFARMRVRQRGGTGVTGPARVRRTALW